MNRLLFQMLLLSKSWLDDTILSLCMEIMVCNLKSLSDDILVNCRVEQDCVISV